MKKCIFYINDKQCFHIGGQNQVLDYFSSDKLFSAIINVGSLIYDESELNQLIKNISENTIFSSMFFGLEVENTKLNTSDKVYFVKKPYMRIQKGDRTEKDLDLRKRVKKIQYISEKVLNELIKSYDSEENKFTYDLNEHIIIGNKFVVHKNEMQGFDIGKLEKTKFIQTVLKPKVSVCRHSNNSNAPYYEEFIQVNHINIHDCNIKPFMYFNIEGEFDEKLIPIFNLMCDEGIGGERNLGAGEFCKYDLCECERFKQQGDLYITLSSVYPARDEVKNINSYMLEDRKGYVYSGKGTSIKKPYIRVIGEGSILNDKVKGQIKKYSMSGLLHPIYVYGKAFLVGFGGDNE